jgi:hypothetical protein
VTYDHWKTTDPRDADPDDWEDGEQYQEPEQEPEDDPSDLFAVCAPWLYGSVC